MANTYNTLGELFTAIANAIRAKKKSSDDIIADNFPEEIGAIETPELQEKTVAPTTSDQTIVPDAGYNGLSFVVVEGMNLQSKTATPTMEEQVITPDDGYDGLSKVTVEAAEIGGDGNSPEADLALTLWEERSKATDLYAMFYNCTSLTMIPLFNTSKVASMGNMFNGCASLTTIPLLNTSNVTNMNSMFNGCASLTTIPLFDTSKVDYMTSMFYNCTSLTTVPPLDTSKVTSMSGMFGNCTSLTAVPLFNTSKVTNMSTMFYNCTSLTTVPLFDTNRVTSMNNMLRGCTSLTTVPLFDTSKVTDMSNVFYGCKKLTDCYLRNIKVNLTVGSGTTYGHLLTLDSLIHLIKELRDTGSSKTLTVGSANLEKLANVYIRTIAITDEMRAEDDLIDEKLPFEVCESTDEGAMLITDYVFEKNWQLK